MKSRPIILAGLAMLLLNISLRAEITTTIIDHSIAVSTDKKGIEGHKGCNQSALEKVPAYVFELQIKTPGKHGTCSVNNTGKWATHSTQTSTDGKAIFNQLPDGKYQIICLSAQAIGCLIEGTKNKSIVYAQEISSIINLGMEQEKKKTQKQSNKTSNTDLMVFPNPASDQINIHLKSNAIDGKINIILYDMLGAALKRMEQVDYQKGTLENWAIDISHLPAGTYLIRVYDEKGTALYQKAVFENR